ncbi:uncharacterized protein [Chelonus insularis]|uniref:uncharacterized protein n=1 Tax=Chelonus insularis TaxID=460826 RepID=UPI001588AADF|nr:uncharacterized protein LOC118064791 [Chelonus insularis]
MYKEKVKIRLLAQLIGSLVAACPAIKYGWLYTKKLEREKFLSLLKKDGKYDCVMRLPEHLREDFEWWKINIMNSRNSFKLPSYKRVIFTDASLSGWGAYCEGTGTHGSWSVEEKKHHINYLELLAIFFALKSFASDLYNCNILLRVDNTTAISYINRMGGIQHQNLNILAREIWQWCEQKNNWIFASYIPSQENEDADRESGKNNVDTEWEIGNEYFRKIVRKYGTPEIDLFANRINKKCEVFCSWFQDPESFIVDAFTINWHNWFFYAFPPFAMIPRVIQKIVSDRARGILVVPYWTTQAWFPVFETLLIIKSSLASKNVFDCRKAIRTAFEKRGLPSSAVEIVILSLAEGTIKQYAGPIKEWFGFCEEKKQDPYNITENNLLEFLSHKFQAGAAYGSLNSMRAAISLLSEKSLSSSLLLNRFFKGVYRNRPLRPKYDKTRDPKIVLDVLETWFPLESLKLSRLTLKVATSLALGTAHRIQTLALIKVSKIKKVEGGLEIEIEDFTKTSKKGVNQPLLFLPYFKDKPQLCIASTVEKYIEATNSLRNNVDKLLITFKKPYKEASTQTISRWVKSVLTESGVPEEFTAYSTRHASTSTAYKKGIDINTIKSTAGWTKSSEVFARFYNRPIKVSKSIFAETVCLQANIISY